MAQQGYLDKVRTRRTLVMSTPGAPTYAQPAERLLATAERSARITSLVNEAANPAAAWAVLTGQEATLEELENAQRTAEERADRTALLIAERRQATRPLYEALDKARAAIEALEGRPIPGGWWPRLDELRTQRQTTCLEAHMLFASLVEARLAAKAARRELRIAAGRPVESAAQDATDVLWSVIYEVGGAWPDDAHDPDLGEALDGFDAVFEGEDAEAIVRAIGRVVRCCVDARYGRREAWEETT